MPHPHPSPAARPQLSRREAALILATAVGASLVPRCAAAAPSVPGPLVRIGSNENPFGLGPRAKAAFEAYRDELNRYAHPVNARFLDRIAREHDVPAEQVVVTPGSGEALRAATAAFTGPSRALVMGTPTFELPGVVARQVTGAPIHAVPVLEDGRLDLASMAAKAAGAGLFFVCNPNNPTGGVHTADAVADFVARVRKVNPEAVILMDEAYHEYVEDPGYATALALVANDARLVVSRTFSKVYGMAGMRAGYAIGQAGVIGEMRRQVGTGTVNGLAAATAIAALDDPAHVATQKALNREARAFTRQAFADAGYTVLPSDANFLMVHVRRSAAVFQDQCRESGIVVARPFPPLDAHARISIGTLDEMRRAIPAMLELLATPASARAGAITPEVWAPGTC